MGGKANPDLERAKQRRTQTRSAVRLIREAHQTRRAPILLGPGVGERAVAVAARILEDRCALTSEDPDTVLDGLV